MKDDLSTKNMMAVLIPHLALMLFDILIIGKQFYSLPEDAVVGTYAFGAQWFLTVPHMVKHMPSIPHIQVGGLHAWIAGENGTLSGFNNVGIGLHIALLIAGSCWAGWFSAKRDIKPASLIVVSCMAATMPAMMRYGTMFSLYYSFGFLSLLGAIAVYATLTSGLRDLKANNHAAFLVGAAIPVMYLGGIAIIVMLVSYFMLQRSHQKYEEKSKYIDVVKLICFTICLSSAFSVALEYVYKIFGRIIYSAIAIYTPIIIGYLFLIKNSMRNIINDFFLSAVIAAIIATISYISSAYTKAPSPFLYPHLVAAVFPACLVTFILRRTGLIFQVTNSPVGMACVAMVLVGNLAAPFLFEGALLSFTTKNGAAVKLPVLELMAQSDFRSFFGVHVWYVFLPLSAAITAILGGYWLRNSHSRSTTLGVTVATSILALGFILFLTLDVLFLPHNDPPMSYGIRSRYLLPLIFIHTILYLALAKWMPSLRRAYAVIVLVISTLSIWEYTDRISPIVMQTNRAFAEAGATMDRFLAQHPSWNVSCHAYVTRYCDHTSWLIRRVAQSDIAARNSGATARLSYGQIQSGPDVPPTPTLALVDNASQTWQENGWTVLWQMRVEPSYNLTLFVSPSN